MAAKGGNGAEGEASAATHEGEPAASASTAAVSGGDDAASTNDAGAAAGPKLVRVFPRAKAQSPTAQPGPARRGRPASGESKRGFVLAQPEGLSAAEIVSRAAAAGISLNAGYVHTIRSRARTSAPKAAPARKPVAAPKSIAVAPKKRGRPAGKAKAVSLGTVSARTPSAVVAAHRAATGAKSDLDLRVLELLFEHGYEGVTGAMERIREKVLALI
jgi:hypothetical protein